MVDLKRETSGKLVCHVCKILAVGAWFKAELPLCKNEDSLEAT